MKEAPASCPVDGGRLAPSQQSTDPREWKTVSRSSSSTGRWCYVRGPYSVHKHAHLVLATLLFVVQSHGTRPKYPDSTSCGEPTRYALHHNSDNLLARPGRLMSQSAESRLQDVPVYSRGRQVNQEDDDLRSESDRLDC